MQLCCFVHTGSAGLCLDKEYCSAKADGLYKDPDTCYGFIKCRNGEIQRTQCPKGMMYNDKHKECRCKGKTTCNIPGGVRGMRSVLFFID